MTTKFDELFDSKEQAVTAYLRLERKYLSLEPNRIKPKVPTNEIKELLQWAEGQRDKQTKKDSNFIIVNNCYKSIWGQVISKIQSMIRASQ